MPVEIEQFMCRSDNFGVLVHDPESGQTAIIDAPEEAPILAAIERTGWTPTMILTTHHHVDHVEANLALKQRFKLRIVGPEAEGDKIPGIDETVGEGSVIHLGDETIEVIDTPGHTAGHVSLSSAGVESGVHRRHAVCARMRAAVRMQAAGDVRLAEEARRAAGRNGGLLRPRIHACQCPFRADRRSDQLGA